MQLVRDALDVNGRRNVRELVDALGLAGAIIQDETAQALRR
jgi:hypothetical protein